MSNRLDQEFPQSHWFAVPPIGPDGQQTYLERARQVRAEAMAASARWLVGALLGALRRIVQFVRHAGYGAAWRPPQGDYAITRTPGCLTRGRG